MASRPQGRRLIFSKIEDFFMSSLYLTLFNLYGVKFPSMVLTSQNSTLAFVAIFLIVFSNNTSYLMILKE